MPPSTAPSALPPTAALAPVPGENEDLPVEFRLMSEPLELKMYRDIVWLVTESITMATKYH